jgi:hypothetical protein
VCLFHLVLKNKFHFNSVSFSTIYIHVHTCIHLFYLFILFCLKKKKKRVKLGHLQQIKKKIMGPSFSVKLHLDNPYKNESRFLKRGNNSNIKLSILYLCLNCQNMQWDKTVYLRKKSHRIKMELQTFPFAYICISWVIHR